jgi:transcriptional regulator with XRE-family HTH domain
MVSKKKTKVQEEFGIRIREKRTEKGLTQEALAERVGLHFTYISSVERGERNVSLANIHRFANGLECQVAELLKVT